MTKRIAFVGAAGCGKTTLCSGVFYELKKQNINVECVPEWVRSDIQMNGSLQSIWEQYRTLNHQRALEQAIPDNVDYVIIDSGVLTPYFYACHYVDGNNPRQRLVLQDMYKYFIDDLYLGWYDHIFYLPLKINDTNILDDGTRFQSTEELLKLDMHMNLVFNIQNKLQHVHCVDVPLDQRISYVINTI